VVASGFDVHDGLAALDALAASSSGVVAVHAAHGGAVCSFLADVIAVEEDRVVVGAVVRGYGLHEILQTNGSAVCLPG